MMKPSFSRHGDNDNASSSNNYFDDSMFRSSSTRSLSPPTYKKSKKQFNNESISMSHINSKSTIIPPPITLENEYEAAATIYRRKNFLINHQENLMSSVDEDESSLFINKHHHQQQQQLNSSRKLNYYENNVNNLSNRKIRNRSSSPSASISSGGQSLFPQSVYKSAYSNDDNKCHVCGDKSTGSHFGGLSCESCKAFFRRSVQNDRHLEYKCTYQNTCEMNINTRKVCQACRYRTCLNIGMKPKWVLSDTERLQKYGSRRRKVNNTSSTSTVTTPQEAATIAVTLALPTKMTIKSEPKCIEEPKTPLTGVYEENSDSNNDSNSSGGECDKSVSSSPLLNTQSNNCCSVNRQRYEEVDLFINDINGTKKKSLEEEFYKNGVDSIDATTVRICEYDVILIDKIVFAYFYARQMHEMNMGNINAQMATALKNNPCQDSMQRSSKISAANFIREPVKRLVTFAKLLPDFRNLQLHDQVRLLRSSAMEMIICSSINLFDTNTNTVKNVISRDRNIEAKDKQAVKLNLLKSIWPENVFIRTITYLKSMVELKIDEATLVLYLPLILFSPDRHELNNRSRILEIQGKYAALLYKYLLKQQKCVTKADRIYKFLLLKLIELRELHELHSAILLDVEIDKIDEYPQEIIKSVHEENLKLRGNFNTTNSNSPASSSTTDLNRNTFSSSSSSYNFDSSPAFSMTPSTPFFEFDNI